MPWLLVSLGLVGVVVGPLLAGFAPLGGDPELLYQPIKVELARALSAGRLPFWSDRFGLGIPLVAESHVAAFYPPNWLFYRLWDVATAYRLTMWLHWIALAAATYTYARALEISQAGSALASISFALCGFQAVHAPHEPFYHLMPYLLLSLYLADRFALTGRVVYLAGLALAWGLQLTLGHFQIQMWTGALVAVTGGWRSLGRAGPLRAKLARIAGLFVGLGWGAAIACAQLSLTWELTRYTTFFRPAQFLSNYLFPISHWAQFALPEVYLGRPEGAGDSYWQLHRTTPGEACAYAGIVPLILAAVGFLASRGDRVFTPWRLILPVAFALATMAEWWPDAYFVILQVPGLGWFRAPARYTLLTSLALALFAGRGLDHATADRRFWAGLALAVTLGSVAWAWSIFCARTAEFQAGMGANTLIARFAAAGALWALGLLAIVGWRRNRVGAWAPLLLTALELAGLFFVGPVSWRRPISLPAASPLLGQLATLPGAGLVAGRLLNLPVDAGQTAAYPNLGITPPPPNYLLESATLPPGQNTTAERQWQRRFGVTHGVWSAADDVRGTEIIAIIADPALDQVMSNVANLRKNGLGPWKLVRNPGAFPPAWVSRTIREAPAWGRLYTELSSADHPDIAWSLAEDRVPPLPEPVARAARVESYDGQRAVVSHDGSCLLTLRRTYYPGWFYQVDDGPRLPVQKINGGLQGVPLSGSGTSHVDVSYEPTGFGRARIVSLTALAAATCVLIMAGATSVWRFTRFH